MEEKNRKQLLRTLFCSTFCLSMFTFGGGYVIVTLMKQKFVDEYHWIKEDEMLDLVAIAQSAPGAVAVNGAIVTGYQLAGVPGVLTAVAGTILPPFLILSVISVCYDAFHSLQIISWMLEGMQAGVSAVIASVVWDMAGGITKEKDLIGMMIMGIVFILTLFWKIHVAWCIFGAGMLGLIRVLIRQRRKRP